MMKHVLLLNSLKALYPPEFWGCFRASTFKSQVSVVNLDKSTWNSIIISGLCHNSWQDFVVLLTGCQATSGPAKILVLLRNRIDEVYLVLH